MSTGELGRLLETPTPLTSLVATFLAKNTAESMEGPNVATELLLSDRRAEKCQCRKLMQLSVRNVDSLPDSF